MARTHKSERIEQQQALVAEALKPYETAVWKKVGELASTGDPASVAIYAKHTTVPLAAPEPVIHLPELVAAPTLQSKLLVILSAIGEGRISPGVAESLCKSLAAVGTAAALDQFNERLAAVERQAAQRTGGVLPVAPRVDEPRLPLA